jgi:hypothetical protein
MARKRETDLTRYDWRKAERGKYLEKAEGSLELVMLDKNVVKALGGPLAIASILRALADAVGATKPRKGRAA